MIPRILIDTVEIPGESKKLSLYRRGSEFSISIGAQELMNSRVNGSEKALAELACQKLSNRSRAKNHTTATLNKLQTNETMTPPATHDPGSAR